MFETFTYPHQLNVCIIKLPFSLRCNKLNITGSRILSRTSKEHRQSLLEGVILGDVDNRIDATFNEHQEDRCLVDIAECRCCAQHIHSAINCVGHPADKVARSDNDQRFDDVSLCSLLEVLDGVCKPLNCRTPNNQMKTTNAFAFVIVNDTLCHAGWTMASARG